MFQCFGQRELQIHFATEGQHHDEKGKAALCGSHRDRTGATPVHLGALSGRKVKCQESRPRFGAHLAHESLDDGVTSLEAAFLELLENLLGRVSVLFQQADDVALERIEFAGALGYGGWFKTLPPGPLAHRVQTQFEFAGNLPQAQLLFGEQLPNLAIGLIINHARPPIALRKISPTLTGPRPRAPGSEFGREVFHTQSARLGRVAGGWPKDQANPFSSGASARRRSSSSVRRRRPRWSGTGRGSRPSDHTGGSNFPAPAGDRSN